MFKTNHKAKSQLTNDQTTLACDLTYFSTNFINQIVRFNRWSKMKLKKKKLKHTYWPRTGNGSTENNGEVSCLWKCLGFVALFKTNNFRFWIEWFRVHMREIWSKQVNEKLEKTAEKSWKCSWKSLECGGKEVSLNGGKGENKRANHVLPPQHPVGGAWGPREQRAPFPVGPTASLTGWPSGHTWFTLLSRAPSVRRPISWASDLRFRIRFRITNRDSLTHDYDYSTLKNGWEIISGSDDEDNPTYENVK